jgi:hypothetical protein
VWTLHYYSECHFSLNKTKISKNEIEFFVGVKKYWACLSGQMTAWRYGLSGRIGV